METPHWLAIKERHDQARAALQKIRNQEDVESDLNGIFERAGVAYAYEDSEPEDVDERTTLLSIRRPENSSPQITTLSTLFSKRELHKPLILAFMLQVAQQFSGS